MPADSASVSPNGNILQGQRWKLKFKTENMKDSSDPARTYTVEMTYGGGLYKLYLVGVGETSFHLSVQY